MIAGIVLAAGQSRRMGEPKAFLRAGRDTFLARVVHALRGACADVVVVAGSRSDPTARAVHEAAEALGARTAENPAKDSPQIESLQCGLAALSAEVEGAMVCPVDVPGVTPALARALADAFARTGAPVVAPAHGGRHGHPILFSRALFAELMRDGLAEGARTVVHAHAGEIAEVPVDSLAADVDTPDDYRRWVAACP